MPFRSRPDSESVRRVASLAARHRAWRLCLFACLGLGTSWFRAANAAPAADSAATGRDSVAVVRVLQPIEVTGAASATALRPVTASQGLVLPAQIELRPLLRPGDFLESVPGLLVSQHSGEGKANQYYLRGFNLDHGTDFATTVAGVPMNMPSHAHGQGYTDLGTVIPELVAAVEFRKGTYSARDGDFSSAGSARVAYRNSLPTPIVTVATGQDGHARLFAGASRTAGPGHLLGAIEVRHEDGPWVRPDDYRKLGAFARFTVGTPERGLSVTALANDSRWDATDQVPKRAVDSGRIDRFGNVDPSDGGTTHRYSLSGEYQSLDDETTTRASAYLLDYRLDLFSNFTYFLDDTVHGDQIEQFDARHVLGFEVSRSITDDWFAGDIRRTVGVAARHDQIGALGLYRTQARRRLSTLRADRAYETSLSPYVEGDAVWTPGVRTIVGVRADGFLFHDASSYEPFTGGGFDGLLSPKASLVLGPWRGFGCDANAGLGFHSEDVRGANYSSGAGSGTSGVQKAPDHFPIPGSASVPRTPLLTRTRGAEAGVKYAHGQRASISASGWVLLMTSEYVFVGDAGVTELGRPSRRSGIEVSGAWAPADGLRLAADGAWSRARFTDFDPAGDHVPGSIEGMLSSSLEYDRHGRAFGSIRLRYFGPRPLIEDGSVRSPASTTWNLEAGCRATGRWSATLAVFNLLDAKVSDIDYFYTSRLPGEPAGGFDDIHFHPQVPRTIRVALTHRWSAATAAAPGADAY